MVRILGVSVLSQYIRILAMNIHLIDNILQVNYSRSYWAVSQTPSFLGKEISFEVVKSWLILWHYLMFLSSWASLKEMFWVGQGGCALHVDTLKFIVILFIYQSYINQVWIKMIVVFRSLSIFAVYLNQSPYLLSAENKAHRMDGLGSHVGSNVRYCTLW